MTAEPLPNLEIRLAGPDDVPAVAAIHVEGYESAHRGILSDENLAVRTLELRRRVWGERLADPPERSFVLVAVIDGEVVGFISGRASRPDEDDGEGLGRWEDIYVSSRHKPRSRIAAPLAHAAYERYRELGYPGVVGFFAEGNDRARLYLDSVGMRPDGHTVVVDGSLLHRVRFDLGGEPAA